MVSYAYVFMGEIFCVGQLAHDTNEIFTPRIITRYTVLRGSIESIAHSLLYVHTCII